MLAIPGTPEGQLRLENCKRTIPRRAVRGPCLRGQRRAVRTDTHEEEQADGQTEDGHVVDVDEAVRADVALLGRGLENLDQPNETR